MSDLDTTNPQKTQALMVIEAAAIESSDLYAKVIAQPSFRWRVILCAQGLQWIIQKKESSHAGPWRAEKYVTSRSALIKACGTLGLLSDPATEAVLYALPDYVSQLAKK